MILIRNLFIKGENNKYGGEVEKVILVETEWGKRWEMSQDNCIAGWG